MKEKNLFKLAIICTVLGILVLYFVSSNIKVSSIDISSIDSTDIGNEVRVLGKVLRVSNTEKVMFLQVGQEKIEDVSVVLFKDSSEIRISEGDYIELIGTLDDYNGQINIIANAVKVR